MPSPLKQVSDAAGLRAEVAAWRGAGQRIAFVPTMGNLHAGHYGLVEIARRNADRVVASIFVNPTQFGPNEDFARYPRTPAQDAEGLAAAGCDLLFLPEVDTLYPLGIGHSVRIEVPDLADVLCGAHRPGHFSGVATVVARLLNLVQPDVAIFGRKDLQQLQLIRHLVADLAFPVEIIGAPTRREPDGLALSSRNQYLDADQRARAAGLNVALRAALKAVRDGRSVAEAEALGGQRLREGGFEVDYLVLRRESRLDSLDVAWPQHPDLVALGAVRLGSTRLIDNIAMSELGD
ncbi:pantoate--beta-alanine ligase [Pseudomarimonas salicorniae]|uniref:Pantothenate synthetase n=1 Tax=Pseudomarimonas salicorniae TaxID=2933270 RepID=A0ABT0GN70_9GAMM|nr:pantoate--beta-alanine ligase [Lysobacter sp. CAU 1642]MCK7595440.1 pantoate--beta-alanine ligase [Lysobacter sp. CAU 1642]